jgi:RNA-directed DNA polymerase
LGNRHGPRWILEGDIKACFDRINHEWLLAHIPMDKELLRRWLQAGFLEKNALVATTEGTPQGGIISPVLANCALDGLQQLLAEHFPNTKQRKRKVHLVRYADDFIITGTSKVLLEYEVKPLVAQFLSARGLELSHEKTTITHLERGFDFLGQRVRRYRCGKVLLKPCKRSIHTFLTKIQNTIDDSGSLTAGQLIERLNQQIKGWTMYHRHASSKRIFTQVDRRIFRLVWHWCRRRHKSKSWTWIKHHYFHHQGNRQWVFTGTLTTSKGRILTIPLMEAANVRIRGWIKIRSEVNPYDPEWELYLEARQRWKMDQTLAGRERIAYLWKGQDGRCTVCQQPLLEEASAWWHIHHRRWRSHGGTDTADNLELLHANCHRQIHAREPATAPNRVSSEALAKA